MKRIVRLMILLILSVVLIACKVDSETDKIKVVATIFPEYDMVKAIGKDKVDVTLMLLPGQDIHSYDPSTADIIKVKKSDIFIYTGEAMETWAPNLITTLSKDVKILELASDEKIILEGIDHDEHEEEHEEHEHDVDMHIWTNPIYAIIMVEKIRDILVLEDPDNKTFYTDNANEYINELEKIDSDLKQIVSQATRKTLYFGCPFSFFYLTRQYDLEYRTVYDTCSIEVEPTVDKIIAMSKDIKNNNIPVLYTKELLNTSIAEKIIKDTNAELCLLHSGHSISNDDFDKGITFLEICKNNVIAIRKGLS